MLPYLIILAISIFLNIKISKRFRYPSGDTAFFINAAQQLEKHGVSGLNWLLPFNRFTFFGLSKAGLFKTDLYILYVRSLVRIKRYFKIDLFSAGKLISMFSFCILGLLLAGVCYKLSIHFNNELIFIIIYLLILSFPGLLLISSLPYTDLIAFVVVILSGLIFICIDSLDIKLQIFIGFIWGMVSFIILFIRLPMLAHLIAVLITMFIATVYWNLNKYVILFYLAGLLIQLFLKRKYIKDQIQLIKDACFRKGHQNYFIGLISKYEPKIFSKYIILNLIINVFLSTKNCFSLHKRSSLFGLLGGMTLLCIIGFFDAVNIISIETVWLDNLILFSIIFIIFQLGQWMLDSQWLDNNDIFNSRETLILVPLMLILAALSILINPSLGKTILFVIFSVMSLIRNLIKVMHLLTGNNFQEQLVSYNIIEPSSSIKLQTIKDIFNKGAVIFSDLGKQLSLRRPDEYFVTNKHIFKVTEKALENIINYYGIEYLLMQPADYYHSLSYPEHDQENILKKLYFKTLCIFKSINLILVKEIHVEEGKVLLYKVVRNEAVSN